MSITIPRFYGLVFKRDPLVEDALIEARRWANEASIVAREDLNYLREDCNITGLSVAMNISSLEIAILEYQNKGLIIGEHFCATENILGEIINDQEWHSNSLFPPSRTPWLRMIKDKLFFCQGQSPNLEHHLAALKTVSKYLYGTQCPRQPCVPASVLALSWGVAPYSKQEFGYK